MTYRPAQLKHSIPQNLTRNEPLEYGPDPRLVREKLGFQRGKIGRLPCPRQ